MVPISIASLVIHGVLHALISALSTINFWYAILLLEIKSLFFVPGSNRVHHLGMAFGKGDKCSRRNLCCSKNTEFDRYEVGVHLRLRQIRRLGVYVNEQGYSRGELHTLYSLWTKPMAVDIGELAELYSLDQVIDGDKARNQELKLRQSQLTPEQSESGALTLLSSYRQLQLRTNKVN